MKQIIISTVAILCSFQMAFAQELTMEDVVFGTEVAVPRIFWHWTDNSEIAIPGKPDIAATGSSSNLPEDALIAGIAVEDNNISYLDLKGKKHPVTRYLDKNIVCGQSVSRHEFGIDNGWFVSPDARKVAFYRKDESRVTDYPLYSIESCTGETKYIKYPMNGTASEIVSLGVYDAATSKTVWLKVTDFDEERYLTNITWGPESDCIYIQVLDRAQKQMHLNCYDAVSGEFIKTLLTEENQRFVEPQWPLRFLSGNTAQFLYQTDNRDGFKNIYLCSVNDGLLRRITTINADVEFISEDGKFVYCLVASPSTDKKVYRFSLKSGKGTCLTPEPGIHNATFSKDFKYFVDTYTSFDVPRACNLRKSDGTFVKEIGRVSEDMVSPKMRNCIIETGTLKSADGKYDNAYSLVKPADFDPSKKYPLILYVYGGPHLQMITNSYRGGISKMDIFLAQHGYIVFTMDNRGTPNHGAEYEKAIHKQCGKAEMEDQMVGVRWMMSQPWIDSSRIGVEGWSYGGFMTISLMVNYPDVFKVGTAGGPVIDWKWYEIMYGERYMETPATNPDGFAATSLIGRAKDLSGKLLICQGVIDDTVVWQHSLSFVEDCIKNGVQVDYFPYPTHPHNVRGKDRIHLMTKIFNYYEDYLK